jgi:hypothetical protein
MSLRSFFYLALAVSAAFLAGASGDKTLEKVAAVPEGISPEIAASLDPHGSRIESGEGTVCDVWLLKQLAIKGGFKPSQNVKYPFQPGQLIGVLRVGDKVEFTDFRGQPVKPGVYTLRYGQQPQDGNHLGTSEVSDFLLAIPVATDTDPKPLGPIDKLQKASAKAVGTNHPAIFSLLPVESAVAAATLAKDESNRWVLGLPARGTQDGKKVPVSLRLVVVGKAEG